MARLNFADHGHDIDLIVFDKDGTLIDFDFTWCRRTMRAVDRLIAQEAADPALRGPLLAGLGVEAATARAIPESPLVVGTAHELVIVAATVLFQAGWSWTRATMAAEDHLRPALTTPPDADEVRALGDVAGLFTRLRAAGVAVGVLTNDDRAGTVATLFNLGLLPLVSGVVCADDQLGAKPEPGGLLYLASRLGTGLDRVAMVGDAVGDMVTARRAGAALAVGVLSGAARREALAPHADVIIEAVSAISIAG